MKFNASVFSNTNLHQKLVLIEDKKLLFIQTVCSRSWFFTFLSDTFIIDSWSKSQIEKKTSLSAHLLNHLVNLKEVRLRWSGHHKV